MNKKHKSNRAILILEAPWELDDEDANRSSVLPFFDGISKLAGDTEVYHANFYDKNSFDKALDCLCKTKFRNTIVYIAAHGYKKKIGNMSLLQALVSIGMKSKEYNITGVMLGSCFVGENDITMAVCLEGTNLKWCAGYSSSSYWFNGTLIDSAIVYSMSQLENDDFYDKNTIIDYFANAISCFSRSSAIGNDYTGLPVRLDDSLTFVIQPSGQGHKARTVTSDVFISYDERQLPSR